LAVITVANFLIAAACGLLWTTFAAPAILRLLGIPVAFGIWRIDRRNQHLTKTQYVWGFGVFMWGIGMFLFFVIARYLDWKLLGVKIPMNIFVALVTWLTAGWLVGVLGARRREGADLPSR
jgi:hypothetical protein